MDHSRIHPAKASSSSGGLLSCKTSSQLALVRTVSLVILSLIVVLAWESTRPLSLLFPSSETGQHSIQSHLDQAVKTHTLWTSSGKKLAAGASGERLLEAENWKVTGKLGAIAAGDLGRILENAKSRTSLEQGTTTSDVNSSETWKLRKSTKSPSESLDDFEVGKSRHSLSIGDVLVEDRSSDLGANNTLDRVPKSESIHRASSKRNAESAGRMKSSKTARSSRTRLNTTVHSAVSDSISGKCDFSRGSWVKDQHRPFYSGNECTAYLSGAWACRQMRRPDFDYEKFRWQPEGCDLPYFTAHGFLQRLRNKVVAFVGDSLGRQQFQSLMCMLTEGKHARHVENVSRSWGPDVRWAYRFPSTNTTVLFYWSTSLCAIEKGHPNETDGFSAMHLDRPEGFLMDKLHVLDVVVLNTGHHWNRGKLLSNKWHPYVHGRPLNDRKLAGMGAALNFTVHKVVQWLDSKLAHPSMGTHQPAVFLRTLSPRHFKNGEWDSGGTCDSTEHGPNQGAAQAARAVFKGPVTDRVAENAVRGTRVNLLNITYLSQFREEGHISKYGSGKDSHHQDCLHWCLPGVPDVWNQLLYAYLVADPSFCPLQFAHQQ